MLKERLTSALSALALLAAAIYFLPKESLHWIVLVLWVVGAWEWSGFIKSSKLTLRIIYTVLLGSMMLIIAANLLLIDGLVLLLVLGLGLCFWLFSFIQTLRYPIKLNRSVTALAGMFVLVPSYAAFDYLLKSELSLWYVLLALVIIWAADVGAYFTGKIFGKTKLAPEISPNKTREGALGGWVLAVTVTIVGGYLLFDNFDASAVGCLIVTATGVFFLSVVGDLTVSMFKRNVSLKDSGVFLPGHGGVLDRIDSWCAGAVFFTLIVFLFH